MNSLKKINVVVTFPLGANFYQNIVDYTYKQFLRMLKGLSCINIDSKCKDCVMKNSCQYYKLTGENFDYYPGIVFNKNGFEINIFRENEEFIFEIFIVGNCEKYISYIDIFFEEYLNHRLAGFFFQIKTVNKYLIQEDVIVNKTLCVSTVIESIDFISSYNQMVDYYNKNYDCKYPYIDKINNVTSIKNIRLDRKKLVTKSIDIKGYIYNVDIINNISSHCLEIGVGIYNYLGGGKIEIKN